jgi:hypothetical protein
MLVLVWVGLAVFVLASIGGIAVAALQGLSAYRTMRAVTGELTAGVDRVSRDADEIAVKLERLAEGTTGLDAALGRLRVSRARLNVLLQAIAEVRAGIGRITGVVPRKT